MLFDDEKDVVHVLNDSAAAIWDCIEEPSTVDTIRKGLAQLYNLDGIDDVDHMISEALTEFTSKNLLRAD